jgi:hypothetical protein
VLEESTRVLGPWTPLDSCSQRHFALRNSCNGIQDVLSDGVPITTDNYEDTQAL